MERVSVWQCHSYEHQQLRSAVISLLEPLGGLETFVTPGQRVLLKPNMLAGKDPQQAVTTHPALVQVVAELVREAGCQALIGDSPGIGSFQKVAEKSGISEAARLSGAELAPFDTTTEVAGTGLFKRIDLATAYWEADLIINLPKLKTHEMMTMTCAVKNLFGAVVGAEKAGWHLKAGASRQRFARLLLEIYLLKKPALNIVDAVVAMEGDGPGSGTPIQRSLLLAGSNPVAVDLVAGEVAGIPADLLPLEQEARLMGLAGAERSQVERCGAVDEIGKGTPFKLPQGIDTQFGLPEFVRKGLKRFLAPLPKADRQRCICCGICRDACPPAAISIQNSALTIDGGRCIHCWCCRELCPHDAMDIHRGVLAQLLALVVKR